MLLLAFLQGAAQASLDVCVNGEALRLWSGISNSPISIILAGYGIGALVVVFIAKPFVKFNPILNAISDNNNITNTSSIKQSDIKLHIPFTIAGLFGLLIVCGFMISFYYTTKLNKANDTQLESKKPQENSEMIANDDDDNHLNVKLTKTAKFFMIIFDENSSNNKERAAKVIKSLLLFILCVCVGGYTIVLSAFRLTYLTTGPGRIPMNKYFIIEMLYWLFFVIGRLVTTIVAFKMNSLIFFTILILLNLLASFLYALPLLNVIQVFYWFIIAILAFLNGPLIPTCIMVAKHIMVKINSVLLALFALAMSIGAIFYQYLTGYLLDKFKPDEYWFGYIEPTSVYIIPIILFSSIALSTFFYLLIVIANSAFKIKVLTNPNIW